VKNAHGKPVAAISAHGEPCEADTAPLRADA
jgi:hypothetical protein